MKELDRFTEFQAGTQAVTALGFLHSEEVKADIKSTILELTDFDIANSLKFQESVRVSLSAMLDLLLIGVSDRKDLISVFPDYYFDLVFKIKHVLNNFESIIKAYEEEQESSDFFESEFMNHE